MRRLLTTIICLSVFISVFAQKESENDCLTILEAMSIVAYRRSHPMVSDEEMDGFVKSVISKYDYKEDDFLEGIGTCMFWQYIKNGHTVHNEEPLDDDYFIPDNIQEASAVAIIDCNGIETIEYDETAISVELRVFCEAQRDLLMNELRNIGFTYKRSENSQQIYEWQSYSISIWQGSSRGHKMWQFTISLNPRDYGSTKHFQYTSSSSAHELKMDVEYPISGSPVLLRRIRTFIMEALELDLLNGWPMSRFNGNPSDGQAVVDYYGRNGVALLKEKHDSPQVPPFSEETKIRKVAETDHFISFEVEKTGWYGGVDNILLYGATFRKSDGKRLHVIANPKNPQFKKFLNTQIYFENKDEVNEDYKDNLPMPKYEPYLIQSGVRFVYQKYEIAAGAVGVIKGDSSFSEIYPFITEDINVLLK